ncbi:SLC13 family permease [Bowmanella sp. JS7-9]|uniref:SLC13 family permease n=1 Tax=Pseudobowmanella zhangzhouensis TaxID=1537679 RepID=A0ABW1XML1_9ALTE|nr:SLC13 family permease [Bowmanella sp. JS7-9]TBX22541.1 transporter [Bowmanella sp. JS7-9]
MNLLQIYVVAVLLITIGALILSERRPSFVFALSTLALILPGILSLEQAIQQVSNLGLITLVLLLLVSMAVDKTSLIKGLAHKLANQDYSKSFIRIVALAFSTSAFLNNTAVVATLLGPVKQSQHYAPSKLLIPLSYAAILGGTLTLIGTSTNLIVDSFLIQHGLPGFSFWDFTLYGGIAGLSCCLLMYFLRNQLPDIPLSRENYQQYFVEAEVLADSTLIGRSIEENALRNLPELYLAEIIRGGTLISPVAPNELIEAGDKLIFTGNLKRVDTLQHIHGLQLFAESDGLLNKNLTEVVISNRSRLIGKTLKQIGFRALFDAAVVAIRRDGEKVSGKHGDIRLTAGDFLVLATGPDFHSRHNLMKNFFIVSQHRFTRKLSNLQEWSTLGGFCTIVLASAFGFISLTSGLLCLLIGLIFVGVLSGDELKRNLPLNLILVIVGALSLAKALENTGVITLLTETLSPVLLETSPFIALVAIYLLTVVMTELMTNNAAAALMFPFAFGISLAIGAPLMPFALAVAFAASASFISPYGYQTNLLVFSAGNYRTKDFIRFGVPISLLYSTIVLALLKWQFNL